MTAFMYGSRLAHFVRRAMPMAGRRKEAGGADAAAPEEIGLPGDALGTMEASLAASRAELARLVEEQAALRRVATLVAQGAPPPEIFRAVACETGRLLAADYLCIKRYEPADAALVLVGQWKRPGTPGIGDLGTRWDVEADTPEEALIRTRKPVRRTEYAPRGTAVGEWAREHRMKYFVLCPIIVEGRVWGLAANSSATRQPEHSEARMQEFMELVGTAIANAHSRAELVASRARVVAASDATRRRIERDLHDGVQQRLVSLGLEMRAAEAVVPPGFREQLSTTAQGLADVIDDLREISRGLHPAILSSHGLRAALRSLIRRLAIPVELDMDLDERPAEPVEVAIYYAVSEALANALKHAHATRVRVEVRAEHEAIRVRVSDDGIGGADPTGSGLLGIRDRIEALGGRVQVESPVGAGTSLQIRIPTQEA